MAKSEGNFVRLKTLIDQGIKPLAYRYWLLGAHYQTQMTFSFEALQGAENAYDKLQSSISELPDGGNVIDEYKKRFQDMIKDDLDTPSVLALIWEIMKVENYPPENKKATIYDFDRVLGLNLSERIDIYAPEEVKLLADKREEARKHKDFELSDELRKEIEKRGFSIKDTSTGYLLRRR
jgi:cysteinyl-tRNA synthetase